MREQFSCGDWACSELKKVIPNAVFKAGVYPYLEETKVINSRGDHEYYIELFKGKEVTIHYVIDEGYIYGLYGSRKYMYTIGYSELKDIEGG